MGVKLGLLPPGGSLTADTRLNVLTGVYKRWLRQRKLIVGACAQGSQPLIQIHLVKHFFLNFQIKLTVKHFKLTFSKC